MQIKILASGSKANCCYIASQNTEIFVDIGLSLKKLSEKAKEADINLSNIDAVLLTHEHDDHIKGVNVFLKNSNASLYCAEPTYKKLTYSGKVNNYIKRECYCDSFSIKDMKITPFRVSHDACFTVGYTISSGNEKVSLITDTGYISESMYYSIKGSDTVLIESNHDVNMLNNGSYSYPLKQRIKSDVGHLSNATCAKVIAQLRKDGAKKFVLCHLSENNNTVELAYNESKCQLEKVNFTPNMLYVASSCNALIL